MNILHQIWSWWRRLPTWARVISGVPIFILLSVLVVVLIAPTFGWQAVLRRVPRRRPKTPLEDARAAADIAGEVVDDIAPVLDGARELPTVAEAHAADAAADEKLAGDIDRATTEETPHRAPTIPALDRLRRDDK